MLRTFLPKIIVNESVSNNNCQSSTQTIDKIKNYKIALIEKVLAKNFEEVKVVIHAIIANNTLHDTPEDKLQYIADIINNNKDTNGNNLFLIAVLSNKIDMVTLLLQYGADINSKNYQKKTALSFVQDKGAEYLSMEQFLLTQNPVTSPIIQPVIASHLVRQSLFIDTTPTINMSKSSIRNLTSITPPKKQSSDLDILFRQRDYYFKNNPRKINISSPSSSSTEALPLNPYSVLPKKLATSTSFTSPSAITTNTANISVNPTDKKIPDRIPAPPPKDKATADPKKTTTRRQRIRLHFKSCPNNTALQFTTSIGAPINTPDNSGSIKATCLPATILTENK